MSIKDNFSQAVKELWKKDGFEETPEQGNVEAGPSELSQYLNDPTGGAAAQQPVQPAGEVNEQGVALETPYYRDPVINQPVNNPAQQGYTQAAAQPAAAAPRQTAQPTPPPTVQQPQQNNMAAQQGYGAQAQGYGAQPQGYGAQNTAAPAQQAGGYAHGYAPQQGAYGNSGFGGGYVPPAAGAGNNMQTPSDTDEVTVISKNTIIDGNVRSLANMQVDGNVKGNVQTTRNIEMSGKVVGDITCNNANMNSAAMQGNVTLKGKVRMDRDTILIGDLTSQYADINGRVRGKLEIGGKAELKRDAIIFGDINASTIAVTDGAIIQGYVNTTYLSKDDSRNVFPEKIAFDGTKDPNGNNGNNGTDNG